MISALTDFLVLTFLIFGPLFSFCLTALSGGFEPALLRAGFAVAAAFSALLVVMSRLS